MGSYNFTSNSSTCNAARAMQKFVWLAAVCALVFSGCASSRVTNLTTTRQPRNATGMYPVEFVWDSNQTSIIDSSIKPYVVIGVEFYPMRPSIGIANRWETVIPVPADKSFTVYHFKVDYQYRSFGNAEKSSKLSNSYRLDIVDK